jgi:hypothetical protein
MDASQVNAACLNSLNFLRPYTRARRKLHGWFHRRFSPETERAAVAR